MSAPVSQRADLLDALRGFALFGVVWSNYAVLSYWLFMSPPEQAALPGSGADAALGFFHRVFIDGKFYSIFSLLFGIGFGFFLDKGSDGLWRFYRRMIVLLIIGWLHLRYIWAGDILFTYAALGLLLPLFRKLGDRTLVLLAALLILSPIAIDVAQVLSGGAFDPVRPVMERIAQRDAELGYTTFDAMFAVPDGGWDEFARANGRTALFRFEHLIGSNRLPKVLGLFLLGLWVARRKLFVDPVRHRALLRRLCIGGFALGAPFSLLMWWSEGLPHVPNARGLVATVSYALAVVPLAIAYASGFTLLWTNDRWRRRLQVFAPMGRMALTNYLMQSVIGVLLFTGIGLGWGMRVSAVSFELLALGVFILQVIWSGWWFKHFHYGPLEWLWRMLTYGKRMPFRR